MSLFHRPLPRTLPAALRDIDDKKIAVRRSAVQDLARHADASSPEVIAALQKALRDADPAVRTSAAYALGDAGASDALSALLMAIDDEQTTVRQAALDALGQIRDPRSTSRLVRATKDERPDVRFQALIALARVSPEDGADAVLAAGRDEDAYVRYIAIRTAEELFSVEDPGSGPEVVLDDRFKSAAVKWMTDEDTSVRAAAAILLARAGDPRGGPVLVDVLEGRIDVNGEEEAAAVMLAGPLGVSDAVPALERRAFGLRRLMRDRFAWHACVSLATMGHERARKTIINDLTSWSRDRRTAAVMAAGRARVAEARPILERMKGDENQADQGAVQEALGLLEGSGSS